MAEHHDPHPTWYAPAEWTGPAGRVPQPYPIPPHEPDWTPLVCLLAMGLMLLWAVLTR